MLFDLVMALTFGFVGWRAAATLVGQRPLIARRVAIVSVLAPVHPT